MKPLLKKRSLATARAEHRARPHALVRHRVAKATSYAFQKLHGVPLIRNVQIQTQSRCQADCVFCPYVESWHAQNHGTMTEELFDKVLTQLTPFAVGINQGKFCPYLMQETLLDKQLLPRIRKIHERFPHTTVEISTNALGLTDKVIDGLLRELPGKNHVIWVSHHGIDPESFQFLMDLDYERCTARLLQLLKRSNGRLNVLIRGAGTSRSGHVALFNREQYNDYWEALVRKHDLNTRNLHVQGFTFHDRAGTIHRTDRDAHLNNQGIVRQINPENPFSCSRITDWIHILYDGTIRLCCMDYHGEVTLPNINDITILDYLRSPQYQRLTDMVEGRAKSPEDFICKRCTSPGG
jgi:hypothetical protein